MLVFTASTACYPEHTKWIPATAAFTLQQSGSCTGILHDIVLAAADPFWTHTYTVGGVTYNGPEHTIQLGTGTHTITHTISNACGSLTSQQTISLADCFECADCDPASVVGTPGQVITLTQAINLGQLPAAQADGISRCIAGTLLLEAGDGYSFTGANIRMYPGAEIVVQNGALFNSEKSSVFYACDGLWQGIRAEAGAQIKVSDSYFVQAYTAFDIVPSIDAELPNQLSDVQILRSVFQDNFVGIYVRARGELAALNAVIVDNDFVSVNKLLPAGQIHPFPGSSSGLPLATLPPTDAYAYTGMVLHDLSLFASTKNDFLGTVNGILAFDTELRATQNTFHDQQVRRTPYLGFRNATGISMRRTGQRIAKLFVDNSNFKNAATGIDSYFGTLEAVQNTMDLVEAGVLVNLPPDTDVTISNNSLKCLRNGITARGLLTNGKLRIENNSEISISTPLHITDAAVRLRGIDSEDAIIRNNQNILVPSIGSGIDVQSCKNLVVENNTVALNNSSLALAGIRLRGCDNLLLSDNTVNGSNASGGTGNIGLQIISSANIFYCKNDFDQTRYGVTVAGSSNSADLFRANTFNQHSTGLLITPGSLLGGQGHQENCWAGSYGSGFGAVYEVDITQALDYPFVIDDRFVSCYNTTESPNGWFDFFPNSQPQNFRSRVRCDYTDFPRQKDDEKEEDVAALVEGGGVLQAYHPSMAWQAQYAAYSRYLGNPQDYNFVTAQAAQQLATGPIGAFHQYRTQLEQATALDSTDQNSLSAYAATKTLQFSQWVQADLALVASGADELTPAELANRTQLAQISHQTSSAQTQVLTGIYQQRSQALTNLSASILPGIQTVTQKLKLPLELTLQQVLAPWTTPTITNLLTLDNIAYDCPLTDGNGVFLARSILSLYEEEPNYPDLCAGQASLRSLPITDRLLDQELADLKLFPNPGKGATVDLQYPLRDRPSTLRITNSQGMVIQHWELPADQRRHSVPIQQLPNGLYFLHWSYGTDQLIKKLIVSH